MIERVVVVYGGELAEDVAHQLVKKKPSVCASIEVLMRNASERPKSLLEFGDDTVVCFIIQTIENQATTEDVSLTILLMYNFRYFKNLHFIAIGWSDFAFLQTQDTSRRFVEW